MTSHWGPALVAAPAQDIGNRSRVAKLIETAYWRTVFSGLLTLCQETESSPLSDDIRQTRFTARVRSSAADVFQSAKPSWDVSHLCWLCATSSSDSRSRTRLVTRILAAEILSSTLARGWRRYSLPDLLPHGTLAHRSASRRVQRRQLGTPCVPPAAVRVNKNETPGVKV